jgi:hypothetical protein
MVCDSARKKCGCGGRFTATHPQVPNPLFVRYNERLEYFPTVHRSNNAEG